MKAEQQQQKRRAHSDSYSDDTSAGIAEKRAEEGGIKIVWTPSSETTIPSLQFTNRERAARGHFYSDGPSPPPSTSRRLSPRLRALITTRISDFTQMRYESDVGSRSSLLKENKLVNMHELRGNYDLWRTLLTFRRRVDGDKGVMDVFRGMRIRGVNLPKTGLNADKFWEIVMDTTTREKDFLQEVMAFLLYDMKSRDTHKETGYWTGVYEKIVGNKLLTDPKSAMRFHEDLIAHGYAPPDWGDFIVTISKEILKLEASHKRAALHRLRGIYSTVHNHGGVYTKLIPFLAKHATITETYKWHSHCLALGDCPIDSSPANAIFEYIGLAGIMAEVKELLDTFKNKKIPIVESSLVVLVKGRGMKDDILVLLVEMVGKGEIDKGVFGDEFWSVLLKDKGLKMQTIMGLIKKFCDVKTLGEKGLSALARRFHDLDQLRACLEDMHTHGISVPSNILASVQQHVHQYAPTVSINPASAMVPDKFHYDQLLTQHLTSFNLPSALHVLGEMLVFSIPIRPTTLHFLTRSILRPRQRGHSPKTIPTQLVSKDDLALAINTLISCLRGGVFVPPFLWQEIFRRLGIEYQLADLERLAVYLVEWYHPLRGQNMLKRYASAFVITPDEEREYYTPRVTPLHFDPRMAGKVPITIRPRHPSNPLRKLFPASFFRAVVEWGVMGVYRREARILTSLLPLTPSSQDSRSEPSKNSAHTSFTTANTSPSGPSNLTHTPQYPTYHILPSPSPQPPKDYYGFSRTAADITWGLRLSHSLYSSGAHLDPRTVSRAICVRARALYGSRADEFRSPLNLAVKAFLRQLYPTTESFINKMNNEWCALCGDRDQASLFPVRVWKDIVNAEERERVLDLLVLGDLAHIMKRVKRRWMDYPIELGATGRDQFGRLKRSGNERLRTDRVVKEIKKQKFSDPHRSLDLWS